MIVSPRFLMIVSIVGYLPRAGWVVDASRGRGARSTRQDHRRPFPLGIRERDLAGMQLVHNVAGARSRKDLVRSAVPRMRIGGAEWTEVGRWWGTGLDGKPMEIDVVGAASDGRTLLVAEAEWSDRSEPTRLLEEIERKAANLPLAKGRTVIPALFVKKIPARARDSRLYGPGQVLAVLP